MQNYRYIVMIFLTGSLLLFNQACTLLPKQDTPLTQTDAFCVEADDACIRWVMQLIKAKVENYWIRPEHFATGASCIMQVQLLPGGQVHHAYIVRSSGQSSFDQTAVSAVQKASPLPIPQTVFEQFKTFNFQFSQ